MNIEESSMDRETMISTICAVLGAHDVAEYATWCCCGKKLYHMGGETSEGAMTLRRHRAECVADALGVTVQCA